MPIDVDPAARAQIELQQLRNRLGLEHVGGKSCCAFILSSLVVRYGSGECRRLGRQRVYAK